MKRIYGLFLLLLPQFANAAAIEETALQAGPFVQDLPPEHRLQVILNEYPKLVAFLVDRYRQQPKIVIPGFDSYIYKYIISPQNSKLIIVPMRGLIHEKRGECEYDFIIWDLKTNRMLHHITGMPARFHNVRITSDEKKFIVSDSKNNASIWDMERGCKLYDLGEGSHIALNDDSSKLLTASWSDAAFNVWDVETGQRLYQFSDGQTFCSSGVGIALSHDGTKVACGTTDPTIIDMQTGQELHWMSKPNILRACMLNSDGTGPIKLEFHSSGKHEWLKIFDDSERNWSSSTGERTRKQLDFYKVAICDKSNTQLCSCNLLGNNGQGECFNDHWFVATQQNGEKICAYDLDDLANPSILFAIPQLSDRQLWLLEQIRKASEYKKKLILNRDNPKLSRIIEDYGTLPDSIKDIVQHHVTFGTNQ